MPINQYWDNNEKTILLVVFEPEWTWQEYSDGLDETREIVKDIEHTYHEIIDMRQTGKVPQSSPIQHMMKGRQQGSRYLGIVVLVGAPKMMEIFVNVFKKAYGTRFPERLIVETIEDAYTLIAAYKDTVPSDEEGG